MVMHLTFFHDHRQHYGFKNLQKYFVNKLRNHTAFGLIRVFSLYGTRTRTRTRLDGARVRARNLFTGSKPFRQPFTCDSRSAFKTHVFEIVSDLIVICHAQMHTNRPSPSPPPSSSSPKKNALKTIECANYSPNACSSLGATPKNRRSVNECGNQSDYIAKGSQWQKLLNSQMLSRKMFTSNSYLLGGSVVSLGPLCSLFWATWIISTAYHSIICILWNFMNNFSIHTNIYTNTNFEARIKTPIT